MERRDLAHKYTEARLRKADLQCRLRNLTCSKITADTPVVTAATVTLPRRIHKQSGNENAVSSKLQLN